MITAGMKSVGSVKGWGPEDKRGVGLESREEAPMRKEGTERTARHVGSAAGR